MTWTWSYDADENRLTAKRLPGWESRGADPQLRAGCVPGGDFPVQDRGQAVLVRPACCSGLVREAREGLPDPARIQRGSEIPDLLPGVLAGHDAAPSWMVIPNARS